MAQAGLSSGYNTTLSYGHNDAGQISSVSSSEAGFIWTPDYASVQASLSYSSNNLNQYTAVGDSTLSYDANGNLTADWQFTYSYDPENKLTSVMQGSVTVGSYSYDPLGRRAQKVATFGGNTTTTDYLWSGSSVMAEYDGSGLLLRRYIYGAGIDTPLVMIDSVGSKTYLQRDAMGSVIAASDSSGTGLDKFSYGPFGEGASESNSSYKYTARRLDQETGNYYYRARYYHPKLGRFLSPDPIGYGDGLNMYAYVGNDPMNYTDPMGLQTTEYECDDFSMRDDPRCLGPGGNGMENIIVTGDRPVCDYECQQDRMNRAEIRDFVDRYDDIIEREMSNRSRMIMRIVQGIRDVVKDLSKGCIVINTGESTQTEAYYDFSVDNNYLSPFSGDWQIGPVGGNSSRGSTSFSIGAAATVWDEQKFISTGLGLDIGVKYGGTGVEGSLTASANWGEDIPNNQLNIELSATHQNKGLIFNAGIKQAEGSACAK